jgi:hypothetical protein
MVCEYCNAVFISKKWIKTHHITAHSGIQIPHTWRTCKAQHLKNGGPGALRSFWEVTNNEIEEEKEEEEEEKREKESIQALIQSMMKEIEPTLQVLQIPQDNCQISPWLLTTQWHEHIAGLEPSHLCKLVCLPKDNEADMPKLRENIKAYFEEALELLPTIDELILKRLNSPDPTLMCLGLDPLQTVLVR